MSHVPLLDIGCYATIAVFLLTQRRFGEQFRGLGRAHRALLAALIVAIPVGQIIHRSEWTYPWVGWAMYTEPLPGDVTWLEYSLVLSNGEEVAWPVARMFSRVGKRVVWKLKALEREGPIVTGNQILEGLARRFNERHADNPATTIRIWDCQVPITTDGRRPEVRRTRRRDLAIG